MQGTRVVGLLFILSACIYCVALGWELQGLSSYTVPVFMWSDKQIFSNSQVYDTISSSDMEFALSSLLRKDTTKDSKLSASFNENAAAPEVVILFVEPELRTDQVPYISSAFASTPGGSYSHIKHTIESAASSLVMPYAKVDKVTLLDEVLLDISDSINNANIFISGSSLFSNLRQQNGVKLVEIDSLLSEMTAANAFNNGVADLVIVSFDKNTKISEHDLIVGNLLQNIRKSSTGNYVAVYTANMPSTTTFTRSFEQHARSEGQENINVGDDPTDVPTDGPTDGPTVTPTPSPFPSNKTHYKVNYFPGAFIEVLLICAILLSMLFTGACAIFSLQTPDKWEVPKSSSKRD